MQDYLALAIVAVSAGYLARRGWQFFAARKQTAGCGSACGGCASNGTKEVIQIKLSTKATRP